MAFQAGTAGGAERIFGSSDTTASGKVAAMPTMAASIPNLNCRTLGRISNWLLLNTRQSILNSQPEL
jgi:hypothetical protein